MHPRTPNADKLIRSPFRGARREAQERAIRAREQNEVPPARSLSRTVPPVLEKLESELGEATYNCGCGFVFQAAVLTSVDCPHCGNSQAW